MIWIKNNPIMFILILLIIIGIIFYFVRKNKKPESTTVIVSEEDVFPLKYGSRGVEVQNLQRYLNDNNNCGLLPDGIFGKDMEKCVLDIFGTTFVDKVTYDKTITSSIYSNVQDTINEALENIGGYFGGYRVVRRY